LDRPRLLSYSGFVWPRLKRYIAKLHFNIILQTTVAQLVEVLRYESEGPRFCYFYVSVLP